MRYFTTFILVASALSLTAQQKPYAHTNISEDLIKRANVIIRDSDMHFELKEKGKAQVTVRRVATVMNKEGNRDAFIQLFYDGFRNVQSVSVKIYDRDGKVVKRAGKKDFRDYPAISNFSLYEDSRILFYYPEYISYPFTYEVEYKIDYEGLLNTPTWAAQGRKDVAVERSKFSVTFPETYPIRYKVKNIDSPTELRESNKYEAGRITYTWEVSDLKAQKSDPLRSTVFTFSPIVYTAPSHVSLDGNESLNNTWADFGGWFYRLNEDRAELKPRRQEEVREMFASFESTEAKVRAVYEHLQENTRYVNISLGIGGYQSFPANTVDEVGYGDCKALTTYTKAMLKSVGVDANYVLIRAGQSTVPFQEDFPSNQFNHVILSVPTEKDTIWLECTSQRNPYGFLGSFTDNRYGLWIDEGGSQLVRTPKYGLEDNIEKRNLVVAVAEDGSAVIEASIDFSGLQTERGGLRWILYEDDKKKRTWITKYFAIPNSKILEYSFEKGEGPLIKLKVKLEVKNFTQSLEKDMIAKTILPVSREKVSDGKGGVSFSTRNDYRITDSIYLRFPKGYTPQLKATYQAKSAFGEFEQKTKILNQGLEITRDLKVLDTDFDEDSIDDYTRFWKKIFLQENAGLIFRSKT